MNYGKSLCVLCEKPLAGAALISHPCDCPTHHFHRDCLIKHARKSRECPIDQVSFESVICANGVPITFRKPKAEPPQRTKDEGPPKQQDSPEKRKPGNQDVTQARKTADNRENAAALSGSRIMIQNDASNSSSLGGIVDSVLTSALQDSGGLMCALCGKNIQMQEMASPNCCSHWFHYRCLDSYTDKCDICPFEGCYREITAFSTSTGDNYGLGIPETRDYRNMVNAPENFVCSACDKADLHKNRATATPCGHLSHRDCLVEYVREHKKCPACKADTSAIECDNVGMLFFP